MNRVVSRKLLFVAAAALVCLAAAPKVIFPILKSNARIGKQEGGFYLLPTNQLLQPWGEQSMIKGRPVDAALSSNKLLLAVLNTRGVSLFHASSGAPLAEIAVDGTSLAGVAFQPGDREIWASETDRNGSDYMLVAPLFQNGRVGAAQRVPLANHPAPMGIAFSANGTYAYVAMSRTNELAVFGAPMREIRSRVPVGIAPFGVVVSAKHGRIFVSNRGGRRPKEGEPAAPTSGSMALTDPNTGSSASGTISVIDSDSLEVMKEVPVGLAPSGIALSPDEETLAIANGHSDTVSLLDVMTLARTDILIPSWPAGLIGSQPVALAFSPKGDALYVACGGTNAITVVERKGKAWTVVGAMPTAWFPSAVAVLPDGSPRVVNIKGTGNTSNGAGGFNALQFEGSVSRMPAPAAAQLAAGMREVEAANNPKLEPSGGVANLASLGIQHVVFVIKENRTYDQIFGDFKQANGEPSMVLFGRDVTPNQHALAEKYVILDNFYADGAVSFDGHSWLMQSFASDYIERALSASARGYSWNLADSLAISPAGFFWQGAPKPVTIRIYGECSLPDESKKDLTWAQYWGAFQEHKWQSVVGERAGVPALAKFVDPQYPYGNLGLPDQIRAEEFLRELGEFEKSGEMPQIMVMDLTADHTMGVDPLSPTPRAMVADNDLALGRVVEALSKSRFWATTLVLAVEDDAQLGVDHIDGHRTVALAVGPHVRRGAVDSNHYNQTSMVRTIQEIFRIPPRTRFVANARPMSSVFMATPVPEPYQAITPKIALDEMNPPVKALHGRARWAAEQSLAMDWREPDDVPQETLNRIIWGAVKGWDKDYPK